MWDDMEGELVTACTGLTYDHNVIGGLAQLKSGAPSHPRSLGAYGTQLTICRAGPEPPRGRVLGLPHREGRYG